MPENNPLAYILDPALAQKRAQGLTALEELRGIPQSAELARALRMSEAQLPEAQGEGFAWAGPNFMNLFAQMAERSAGRENLQNIDTRAAELRRQATAGSEAEQQQNELIRQQEMAFKRDLQDQAAKQVKGPYKPYRTKDGKIVYVSNSGYGAIDDQGNPYSMNDLEPVYPPRSGGGDKTYASVIKEAIPLISTLKNVQRTRAHADKLTEDDMNELNRTAKTVAIENFTPEKIINYVRENINDYSPEVRDYLNSMLAISADIRHKLSGSAVTEMEKKLTDAFLPSAAGIGMEERMRRLGNLYEQARHNLMAVDEAAEKEFSKPYGAWEAWTPNYAVEQGVDIQRGIPQGLTPKVMALYDQWYKTHETRHPNDPRKNKKLEEKPIKDLGDHIGNLEFD